MDQEHGQTPLLAAVRRGDRKAATALLAAGAEVDPVSIPAVEGTIAPLLAGYTPLMIAAADGDAGLVRDLLAAGANVNAVVDGAAVRKAAGVDVKVLEEGRSALMLAADAGELEIVRILLAAGADAGLRDPGGETALSFAVQRGHDEIADLLQSAGGGGGSAELLHAVRKGAAQTVRAALAAGASPDAAEVDAALGIRTPVLVLAARAGNPEIVEALLAAGAAVDVRTESERPPSERTALLAAAEAGHAGVVRSLLRAGADPKLMDRSFVEGTVGSTTVAWEDKPRHATALILAAERGHAATVEALLEGGADVNGRGAGALPTPLLAAIEGLQPAVVRVLLQAGADVEAGTREETPLSLAVANGSREIVELLLAAGADPKRKAPESPSPLEIARLSGYADLVERLASA